MHGESSLKFSISQKIDFHGNESPKTRWFVKKLHSANSGDGKKWSLRKRVKADDALKVIFAIFDVTDKNDFLENKWP